MFACFGGWVCLHVLVGGCVCMFWWVGVFACFGEWVCLHVLVGSCVCMCW